jgi:Cof subfamily protein (haloacid dehalogenase superfamily)
MKPGTATPRYRILAIDIDGTLVNHREELPPETIAALALAKQAGVTIVLATGRRYSQTLHLVEPLGLSVPLVTAGGALVKNPSDHRTLFATLFERTLLHALLREIEVYRHEVLLNGDTYAEGFDYYQPHLQTRNPHLAEYLELNPGRGRHCPELYAAPPHDVFAGFVMGTRDEMLVLQSQIHLKFGTAVSTNVLRSPRYHGFMCELAPAGVNKWSAICHLASQWGIAAENICAVGDDVNDLPMIRGAGLGVAMGNAVPEVLAAADRIAPTLDDQGVVRVVQWILEL